LKTKEKLVGTTPIGIEITHKPQQIIIEAIILPAILVGYISPYPTFKIQNRNLIFYKSNPFKWLKRNENYARDCNNSPPECGRHRVKPRIIIHLTIECNR